MKIEVQTDDSSKPFRPFALPIVFHIESVDDAARLHALFNTSAILKWLNGPNAESTRREIERRVPKLPDAFERFRDHLKDAYSK